MNKEKGILLSGGGRKEALAELSMNDAKFLEIADRIYKSVRGILTEDILKQIGMNELHLKDGIRRDIMQTLRKYVKQAKFHFPEATVYQALEQMWSDKEKGETVFVAEAENLVEAKGLREAIKREHDYLKTIKLQEVFSGLGAFHDITDTVSNKPSHKDGGEIN